MADDREKLSPFDQWESDSAQQRAEPEQQEIEQSVQAENPANTQNFKNIEGIADLGQSMNQTGINQTELSSQESQGVNFETQPSATPNHQPNYGEKWQSPPETTQEAPNKADVEAQEQSPFDNWEAQTPEQTQSEPQQEQNQEPER